MTAAVHPGEMLAEWQAEHGMTSAELATRLGVTPKHVSEFRHGNDHPSEMIQDTLYGREWQCQQCGKFFDRTTLPRRGFFGI